MLSFIVLFALVRISFTYTLIQPRQSSPLNEIATLVSAESCQFYIALNTQFQCGPQSHLIQYSHKYCQRLLGVRNTFENTQYQDNFRQCLQQKLLAKIQQAGNGIITCDSFKQMDLDSHQSCLAVSFKELSVKDITQFIGLFKDTTLIYAPLCKLATSFAGYWSQVVKGDLMQFIKKQLKLVFPDGDTSACTIKEIAIIEEIITEIEKVFEKVKDIEGNIVLIIEKAKAIRDDFKTIRETIKGIENGSISQLDGLKTIVEKTRSIAANAKIIIDTIKNISKANTNTATAGGQQDDADIQRAVQDMIELIKQLEALKGEVYNVLDNVNSIIDVVDDIRDGKLNIFDGLIAIAGQLDQGVDNIYSIINTSYAIKETAIDLVEAIIKDIEGAVDEVIDTVGETTGEIVGGVVDEVGKVNETVGGIVGGITGGIGGLGGIGK